MENFNKKPYVGIILRIINSECYDVICASIPSNDPWANDVFGKN